MMRIKGLDITRGIAIILMVIYHFFYFLNEYGYIHQNMNVAIFWRGFRAIIITIFLFCVGISMHINHYKKINIKKLSKRILVLLSISITVTVITKVVYPNSWVYFGIIHFITFASIFGLFFIGKFWLSISVAIILFISYFRSLVPYSWALLQLKEPLNLPSHTVDLAPIFPWFWVIAFTLAIASKGWHTSLFKAIETIFGESGNILSKIGKHSLAIYLIHLAILFVIFESILYLKV